MRAKKRALWAAGLGAIALACNVPFLLDNALKTEGLSWDENTQTLVPVALPVLQDILLAAAVAVASILAVGLLAVPVLTGRGAGHQQALAMLATLLMFGLTLAGMPVALYISDAHPPYAQWTTVGWEVGFAGACLALATVVGTGRSPHRSPTT
jgi:hypothetical protein